MRKYDRKDFYVVKLDFNDDKNKFDYPEAIADTYVFINIYKKNNYFALTLKKDGYYVDLINGQMFGENTPFYVKEKKSLAEFLGEGKLTKRQALLEMIYCVPLFASELGHYYANKYLTGDSFNIKGNKSVKHSIEILKAKLKEIGCEDNYEIKYDTQDFFQKQLNKIPEEKTLNFLSIKYSINDFYMAVVKDENIDGEIKTDDNYINTDYENEYVNLFLKFPDDIFWDVQKDEIFTFNNGSLSSSILYQKSLVEFSSLTGKITKAKALEEAKKYAEDFINSYKMQAKYDLSRSRK